jgi:MFS family permease
VRTGEPDPHLSGARPNGTLAVLTISAFVYSMLQSLVVPALTTIQADIGASETAATWIVTAFLLSSSIATPILGRLGDMFGRGQMLLVSLGALIVGTVITGVATTIGLFVFGRIVQGLAGAVMPLAFGIIRDVMPPGRVAGAMGTLAAMLAVGAGTGIVLSGPIATRLGYQWLSWIPLMVIVPAAIAAWRLIPRTGTTAHTRLDFAGALLLTAWLVSLLLAVSQGPAWGWASPRVLALIAVGIGLAAAWIVVELRSAAPLVDVRLMSEATLWRLNLASFAIGFAMQATFAFVPRFAQIPTSTGFGLGVGAERAGLIILPWSVGSMVTGIISGRLAARYGSKRALVVGGLLSIVPFVQLVFGNDRVWLICFAMGMFGVGMGLMTAAMPTLLVMALPPEEIGASTGMNTNIRTIGGAVGTQVVAAIVASGLRADGQPQKSSYIVAFVLLALMAGLAAFAAAILPDGRPRRPRRSMVRRAAAVAPGRVA